MARYRLTAPHILDQFYLPGAVVEWDGDPTPDMIPLDAEAVGRFYSMPWAYRGWNLPMTSESLPGGRHSDGSPVLLNRPENMGRPNTYNPPQPDFRKEIPDGTARETQPARRPPKSFWAANSGSISADAPLRPYEKG